jgi:myo-inositol 2-dehydrogenase/D-chiro-inositol 1-dehydrogenase
MSRLHELNPVRIGIVGVGRATRTIHLPALRRVRTVQVAALADVNQQALFSALKQFGIPRGVADYRELLDDPSIEAIAICVPAQLHVEIALNALNAGKHLFIEKPLALTLSECDQLIARAASLPLQVMVGFNTRWHRLAREARSLFHQGTFGQLESVRSVLTSWHRDVPEWRKRRVSGGGVLLEMAMHHFDLWRYILGQEVEEISTQTRSGIWEDEAATVSARMSCGAVVSAIFAECTSQNNVVEIYGRAGSMSVSFYRCDGLETSSLSDIPGGIKPRLRGLASFLQALPRAFSNLHHGGEWHQSYVEEWKHFVEAIRTGGTVECRLQDGRQALAIALAAIESAATGMTIRVRSAEPELSRQPSASLTTAFS